MAEYATTTENSTGVPKYSAKWWQEQVKASEKELSEFHRDGEKAYRRYLDKRTDESVVYSQVPFKYNLFWANTQILKTSLYTNAPKPMVTRTWDDPMDDVARVAAIMMQRMLMLSPPGPVNQQHEAFGQCVLDRLIAGWGQVWVRFEPRVEMVPVPNLPEPMQQLVDVEIPIDYVPWRDFLYGPSRTWAEVPWVGRRVPMTKEAVEKRFGPDKAAQLTYDKCKPRELEPKGDIEETAYVFEVWCKYTHQVHWFSEDVMLEERKDPLQIDGFFPCPPPLQSTVGTSSLVPTSDFMEVRYQYEELDIVNTRINLLADALKVVGVYDESSTELKNILTQGNENKMVPVSNWAMFAEKGGLEGVVDWFPVEQVAAVYAQVRTARQDLVAQIYELTGISDIMRGISAPRETARTSELKAEYSSGRLMSYQLDVATFVEQVMKIKGSIAAKHVPAEIWVKKTNILQAGQPPELVEQAVALIKSTPSLNWSIKIQADTLGMPDYSNEKEARTEFVTTVGGFISNMQEMMMQVPETAPFILKTLQWAAAGFRSGYQVEQYLDDAVRALEAKAKQPPPPPPPDPKLLQIEAQSKADMARIQQEGQTNQMEAMAKIQQGQVEMQAKMEADQQEFMLEMQKMQKEMQQASQLHSFDIISKQLDILMQRLKIQEQQEKPAPGSGDNGG